MYSYSVLSSDPETAILAIEDSSGKCHLGRALTAAPAPGTTLLGEAPVFGFSEMRAPDKLVPVVLVLLDCDKDVAVVLAAGQLGNLPAR